MLIYTAFILLGAFAGTMAGLLGIGGGIVVVPGLAFIFIALRFAPHAIMHMAAGTSLAAMIITSSVSMYSHHRRGAVLWPTFFRMTPGLVIGVILGAIVASLLSTQILKIIFGLFLLLISLRMFIPFKPRAKGKLPNLFGTTLVSIGIGAKSGLLGVGGGVLTVPFLTYCNTSLRQASGTSAACGFPIALIGTISFIITGMNEANLPHMALGYIYWPAAVFVALGSVLFVPFGAKLSLLLPVSIIRRIFALIVLITAINLLTY